MVSKVYVELSQETSRTILSWVKEANLHKADGRLVTLPRACEVILTDFADVLRSDEALLEDEAEGR